MEHESKLDQIKNEFLKTGTAQEWFSHLETAYNFSVQYSAPSYEDLLSLKIKNPVAFEIFSDFYSWSQHSK